jgi:hypothetical protein
MGSRLFDDTVIIVGRTPEIGRALLYHDTAQPQSDSGLQHVLLPLSVLNASLETNI